MEFFAEGFRKGYFPNTGAVSDLFLDQRAGMSVVGPWAIKYFERATTQKFKFAFTPIPVPSDSIKRVYTYGDPKSMVIFSTTRHPKEAWKFVKFLISKSSDRKLLELTNQIPIRKNLVKDPEFAALFQRNPALKIFAAQAESIAPMDDSPHFVQILDYLGQQYEAAAVYHVISSEKAIKDAAQYVETIYKLW